MANCLMFVLNFIALVCSIPLILLAISLSEDPAYTACDRYLASDLMSLGFFLLFISLMWLIGSCCRMRALLWLHLFIIFLSVVAMVVASVTGMVAIRKGEGHVMPRDGIDDWYKVENFSAWMQKSVRNKELWSGYRTCLAEADYCGIVERIQAVTSTMSDEQHMKVFPVEWSCCQPPQHCGYERRNATFWTVPKLGLAPFKDQDCMTYSNHHETLCYDCETCKAGILAQLRRDFRRMFIFNVGLAVFLMLVSWSACANLRQQNIDSTGYTTRMT